MVEGSICTRSSHSTLKVDLEAMRREKELVSHSYRKWGDVQKFFREEDPRHAEELDELMLAIQREFLKVSREIEECEGIS